MTLLGSGSSSRPSPVPAALRAGLALDSSASREPGRALPARSRGTRTERAAPHGARPAKPPEHRAALWAPRGRPAAPSACGGAVPRDAALPPGIPLPAILNLRGVTRRRLAALHRIRQCPAGQESPLPAAPPRPGSPARPRRPPPQPPPRRPRSGRCCPRPLTPRSWRRCRR